MNKAEKLNKLALELYNPDIVQVAKIIKLPNEKPKHILDKSPQNVHIISCISASIQYCFWYGTSEYRPKTDGINVDSKWVNDLVIGAFSTSKTFDELKEKIKLNLILSDITLLEERLKSIEEVFSLNLNEYGRTYNFPEKSLEMLCTLPTFKKDPFLKKGIVRNTLFSKI